MAGDYESSEKQLIAAKQSFTDILSNLSSQEIDVFYQWILKADLERRTNQNTSHGASKSKQQQETDSPSSCDEIPTIKSRVPKIFEMIAEDLRTLIPLEGVLSSERIIDRDSENEQIADKTIHIDEFLYDDEAVDSLVEEEKINREFCADCGSCNIQSITFISHSMSNEKMRFLFKTALPQICEVECLKTVLDIGSRIGAVLYGAYVYTNINKIIGVEINKDLCCLQKDIIKKYSLDDRISVIHADINECKDVIGSANVIILHNVFEYFLPYEEQRRTWLNLKKAIRKDAILVTVPSLEESISFDDNLMTAMNVQKWLKPLTINYDKCNMASNEDLATIQTMYFYKVLS